MIPADSAATEPYRIITAAELTVRDVPGGDREAGLRPGAAIEYSRTIHASLSGSHLFWGPYFELGAGVYLFKLIGKVEGELSIEWAHQEGQSRLQRSTLVDFDRLVCLVLPQPVSDLEVRGLKTPDLRSFTLSEIRVYQAYAP